MRLIINNIYINRTKIGKDAVAIMLRYDNY